MGGSVLLHPLNAVMAWTKTTFLCETHKGTPRNCLMLSPGLPWRVEANAFQRIQDDLDSNACSVFYYIYTTCNTDMYVVLNKFRELVTMCLPWQHWIKICTNWTNNQPSLLFESTEKAAWKVKRKRLELFANNSWILHHDNAPAHTALSVWEILATKQITVLERPAYSPVLAPNDFFLFPKIKEILKGWNTT